MTDIPENTPEPVPATNQAGEVAGAAGRVDALLATLFPEWEADQRECIALECATAAIGTVPLFLQQDREAIAQIIDPTASWDAGSPLFGASDFVTRRSVAFEKADCILSLATQTAASQEGGDSYDAHPNIGFPVAAGTQADEIGTWQENVEFLLAKCPHTIRGHEGGGSENLIVSLVLTFGKMQHMLAATPAPPTLDFRECCDLSITGADIWEALFAIYKQDVPPAITEGVCNELASCLEWSRPSGSVMAALEAQEAAEDARADCVDCEGGGMWEHCPSCSLTFGQAIGLRRAALATQPATSQEGDSVRRDDIRRSIIRQLGDDPHADRIILNGTDWDIVLEALRAPLAATPTPPALSEDLREAIAMARRCQQARHSAVEPVERDNVLNEAATLLRRLAATPTPPTLSEDAIRKALDNAQSKLGHVSIDAMNGDNLAVTLCSHFDDGEGDEDENGWTPAASDGCDDTLKAIHAVYVAALAQVKAS